MWDFGVKGGIVLLFASVTVQARSLVGPFGILGFKLFISSLRLVKLESNERSVCNMFLIGLVLQTAMSDAMYELGKA